MLAEYSPKILSELDMTKGMKQLKISSKISCNK